MATNGYALAAIRRYYKDRRRVCEPCVRPSDLRFGRSYMEVHCQRCGTQLWVSQVVEEGKGVVGG